MKAATAAGLWIVVSAASGCTHAGGSLPVDAPKLMPYQAPDVDEITGIDSEEAAESSSAAKPAAPPAAKPAPAPAQNQHK